MSAPRFTMEAIELYERDVRLRLPFRFGVVTLTEAPQAFARVRIRGEAGNEAWGEAAELLAPKWFDKNLALSNGENFDQLRQSLHLAADLYLGTAGPNTAFGHFARVYQPQFDRCAARGLNRLIASFGPALIDRAALDALCRLIGRSFYDVVGANLVGLEPVSVAPDLAGFDMTAFLSALQPRSRIAARHTVGLVDPLVAADQTAASRVGDGLPETLEEVVATYGHTWFKLKVAGQIEADIDRLSRIAAVLDRAAARYHCTLDGNEQYEDVEPVIALWRRMQETPRLARLMQSIVFIEQPIARKVALERPIDRLARLRPAIIDESDDDLDAFARARRLGYSGVSSKACKGVYKSMINAARCRRWASKGQDHCFMSGEDLTTQAGLAVQQDLALVSLLGLSHVERNGHHYVNGMAGLPEHEQATFLAAHGDLYGRSHGAVRLTIAAGELAIGSLACVGYANAGHVDWRAMRAMTRPADAAVLTTGR